MNGKMKMAALDNPLDVREGVDRETVETVQSMAGKYKHGWETEIEMEFAPKGLNEDIVRLISEKNGEPGMDDRLAAGGFPALAVRWKAPDWAMLKIPPRSIIRNSITTPSRRAWW
jgi:Fe-S cluster assembly protein SufB